jgi:hypothetical protein
MKKTISILVIIIAVVLIGFFIFDSNFNKNQNETISQEQRENLVSNYIKENISRLSPEPEVLGGTFYITDIKFNDALSGIVEYEDGHIALIADFEYSINKDGQIEASLSNVRGHE